MIKLPSRVDKKNLINVLRNLSWEASEALLYYSQILKDRKNKSNILVKTGENPVTLADLRVNEIMIKGIKESYKDICWDILSEENVKELSSPKSCFSNSEWLWVLDPLDGTKDFIQGTSNYAMHLALSFNQKPYIGVALIPSKNELWITDGDKVWCEKRDGSKFNTNLSSNKDLQEMALVTSKNHRNEILEQLVKRINFKKVNVMGSIGCKIASILRGESDIYICISLPGKSSPKDWDFAAPEAILKAAGGAITNINNEDLAYGKDNFEHGGIIIASNNKNTHASICSEIKEIIKKHEIYKF